MATIAPPASVFAQILDYANRADPYPLYAELRKTPVTRQDDGSYVVSTYREIADLLHNPRISSHPRRAADGGADATEEPPGVPAPFIRTDPPEHDRVRRIMN